jgi:hypothetical protein
MVRAGQRTLLQPDLAGIDGANRCSVSTSAPMRVGEYVVVAGHGHVPLGKGAGGVFDVPGRVHDGTDPGA